jgi:MATE family multidrug resistance protein
MLDLVRLALPVAASRASFMLMSLTDAIVLSRHSPGQLPLVLDAWLPNGVFMGFGLGLVMGVSVLTAELSGQGKGDETGRVFRRGLWVATLYALVATVVVWFIARPVFALVGFAPELVEGVTQTTRILALGMLGHMVGAVCQFHLEALRRPNIVTAVSMSAVLVNLVSALVLVPKYGAIGVVWGTTLSRVYMMLVFLVIVWRASPAFKPSPPAPDGEARRQNTVGLGTGVANIAEWGSFNMTFVIATLVSIDAGTVYGLAVQMMGVIFMIYIGLGTATSVRVAERFGRGETQGVREAGRLGVAASLVVGLAMALLLILLRQPIAAVMLNTGDAAIGGVRLAPQLELLIAAVAFVTIFDGLQGVGSMALRAQEVVWTPTLIHVASYMVVMVPLCAWLALGLGMGVWGVYVGITVASVLAGTGQILALEWITRGHGGRPGPRAGEVSFGAAPH